MEPVNIEAAPVDKSLAAWFKHAGFTKLIANLVSDIALQVSLEQISIQNLGLSKLERDPLDAP